MRQHEHTYQGLTFDTLRTALTAIYWLDSTDSENTDWLSKMKYVVPMQHNFENPIKACTGDTFIQYWIDRDDRIAQDYNADTFQVVEKTADVTVRFLGAQAEQWAKALHHIAGRPIVWQILEEACNATILEYIRPIVPVNVDYFGVGNSAIAFETGFTLRYMEYMDLSDLRKPLEYISLPAGTLVEGG